MKKKNKKFIFMLTLFITIIMATSSFNNFGSTNFNYNKGNINSTGIFPMISSNDTYEVVFSESGLLSTKGIGTIPWSVTMDGETLWSTTPTITFNVPNGTYYYEVSKTTSTSGYTPSPESGNITVDGYNKALQIIYNMSGNSKGYGNLKYNVSITSSIESVVDSNYGIGVFVLTNQYNTYTKDAVSTTTTLSGILNGTYLLYLGIAPYDSALNYILPIQAIGYSQSPEPQIVVVNGNDVSVEANFSKIKPETYNTTFFENGLSPGTLWSVTFNGTTESSSNSTILFSELNGTYSYTVNSVSGYTVSPSFGSITVNGKNISQSVTFTEMSITPIKYNITLTETGLPLGTSWSVTLNGIKESSTTSTILFSELNGTYSYTVNSVSGYTVSPSSGSITVNGKNMTQVVTFKHNTEKLSLTEIYIIIGVVAAIAIIGGAVMVMRRRK